MPIRRTIIIPAILALSAAGSILAGSAVSAAAAPGAQRPRGGSGPEPLTITGELTWRTTNGLLPIHPIRGRPIV